MTKKKKVIGVAGLAAVALVGGTFAYFSQQTTVDNPFDTARYGTIVTEDFNPEDGEDWEPGVEVNKDLYVDNTGDRDVVVRVKFEDFWSRDGEQFKEVLGLDALSVYQKDPTDGLVDGDQSVVHKYFANMEKWMFNEKDGYFYYKTNLGKGQNTGLFLDKVQLDKDTDMGEMKTQYYFTIAPTGQKPVFADNPTATSNNATTIATSSNANEGTWWPIGGLKDTTSTWTVKSVDDLMKNLASLAEDDAQKTELEKYIKQYAIEEDGQWKLNDTYSIYTTALTAPTSGERLGYSDADYILRITVETVQATDVAVKDKFGLDAKALPAGLSGWDLSEETLETTSEENAPVEFSASSGE